MTNKSNLTSTEENRSRVISLVLEKKITNGEAAKQLGLTVRQVQRLKQKVVTEGANILIHGLKGKASNHKINEAVKEKTLMIIKDKYYDFKPGFATEKLVELHQIFVSSQTIRSWMTMEKL